MIHPTAEVSKQVNRKCHKERDLTTFNRLHRPYDLKLSTSWTTEVDAIWRIN